MPPLTPYLFFLITVLAPFTTLKFLNIQLVELFLPFFVFIAIQHFVMGEKTVTPNPIKRLFCLYLLFLAAALGVSLFQCEALALEPVGDFGLLKRPYWISISRGVQLGYGVLILVLGMEILRKDQALAERVASLYLWSGALVCLFAIINFHLSHYGLNILLPGQVPGMLVGSGRADGTFVEPGPFGLYVLSLVALSGMPKPKRRRWTGPLCTLFIYALYLSASKAAGFALTLFVITYLAISGLFLRHKLLATLSIVIAAAIAINLANVYIDSFKNMNWENHPQADGRFMAMHLLPQMFIAHPLAGIGLGNYPLLREKMATIQGLPHFGWDLHGMGLVGLGVELGFPLFVCFLALLLKPMAISSIPKENPLIKSLIYFQPLGYITGLQPNFIYPWLFTAIATSLIFHDQGKVNKNT